MCFLTTGSSSTENNLRTTAANLTNPPHHNKDLPAITGQEQASEREHRSEGLQQQVRVPVAMVTLPGPSKGISWITCV